MKVQPKWIFLAWRRGLSCKPRQTSLSKPELRHGRQNSPQRVSAGEREGNTGCQGGPAASTVGGNRCWDSFLPEVCTRRSVACSLPAGSPAGGRRAHAPAILFLLCESTSFSRKQRNRCHPRCQRPGVEPSSAAGRLRDLARVPSSLSPGLSPVKWEACWLVWKAPLPR